MKKRNIAAVVLLTFLTFGVYPLVWSALFHRQLRKETGEGVAVWAHVLLWLFTFNAYPIYWSYAAGKRLAKLGGKDRSVLCFVLAFLPFGHLANVLILQIAANKA